MWPHLYTPTGLRVGAPQTRNIEYLGYLRSKSYEKRLKTTVIDRPRKKIIWQGGPNRKKLLRVTVSELFSFLSVTNVTNRFSLKMVYLESCPLWNYEADDTWMVTVRRFFTELWPFSCFWPPKSSEIPILEQKYKFHLTHCRNKVVRYEITSSCIFESSLYDDFPRRYGRNQTPSYSRFVFLTSEIPILEQKYKFHLTHCRNKVVRYEITSP